MYTWFTEAKSIKFLLDNPIQDSGFTFLIRTEVSRHQSSISSWCLPFKILDDVLSLTPRISICLDRQYPAFPQFRTPELVFFNQLFLTNVLLKTVYKEEPLLINKGLWKPRFLTPEKYTNLILIGQKEGPSSPCPQLEICRFALSTDFYRRTVILFSN